MSKVICKLFNKLSLTKRDVMQIIRQFENTATLPEDHQECVIPTEILKASLTAMLYEINSFFIPSEFNAENGIYLGTAGVAYMYYSISKKDALKEHHNAFLEKAVEYIKPALNVVVKSSHRIKDGPSLLLGHCGVYAVAAVVFNESNNKWLSMKYYKLYVNLAKTCQKQNFLKCGSDELFVGRAGYVLGSLWLAKELQKPINLIELYEICDVIIRSGKEFSLKHKCKSPLMYSYYKLQYLGASHGLCTILLALMAVPGYLEGNITYVNYVKECVDYLLNLQYEDGNFPITADEPIKSDLVQWCHGAPGFVYLMAKAYLLWKDEKYLNSCKKLAEFVWKNGLLKKGPGLCHGISGNGYVFLLMYRLTGENNYLYKAIEFAKFMDTELFKKDARTPDHPYSLFEGVSGAVCYTADILEPSSAAFPFLEIF